jgi:hypothetical protein
MVGAFVPLFQLIIFPKIVFPTIVAVGMVDALFFFMLILVQLRMELSRNSEQQFCNMLGFNQGFQCCYTVIVSTA